MPKAERAGQRLGRRWLVPFLALAAVAGAVLALWLRFNAAPPRGGLIFSTDLLYYYLPLTERVAERLSRGELPLWNPYPCAGLPLLATLQVGVFYPGTWLALLLPAERALPLRALLECVLGGGFAYGLFRAWGRLPFAAVLGAVLYVFACLLGQSFWPPALSTLVWLPWLLLCVERLARAWRWRWWIGLALGTTLQLLAGFPQFLFYSFFLVAPFALLRLAQPRGLEREGAARLLPALGMALAVALGLGLAGAQLLPTRELIAESSRASVLTATEIHYLGPPLSIAGFLGNAVDPGPKLITFGLLDDAGYLGLGTLVAAAVGLVSGLRSPLTWLLVGTGAAGMLLSQGYFGPGSLYELYAALPVVGSFRNPERLQLLTLFALLALAVAGFDALGRGLPGSRIARVASVAAGLAVVAWSLWAAGAAAGWRLLPIVVGAAALVLRPDLLPLRVLAQLALVLAVVVDVSLATAPYGSLRALPVDWARTPHVMGRAVADAQEVVARTGGARLDRVEFESVAPPMGSGALGRVPRVRCFEPLRPRRWQRLWEALSGETAEPNPRGAAAFYDVASVRQRLSARPVRPLAREEWERIRSRFQDAYRRGSGLEAGAPPGIAVRWIESEAALPRAYWVRGHEVAVGGEALTRLLEGDFDFASGVLLEREPAPLAEVASAPRRAEARIVRYAPERVEIELDAPADGFLVLTDSYYPDWTARRGEQELEILRANALFRAVRVPAGRQRVVFEYRPASFRRGVALSGGSLLALLALPALARRRGAFRSSARPEARDG